uniref:Uncharacterized protein n=1 Tax=Anopheles minimus TaxID=112268 RepID=A0A182VTU6_9DIPT
MKLLYVCCSVLLAMVAFGTIEAVPVEDGVMVVMEDPMQEQQPALTLEDVVAVNDQTEMDQGEMVREKRHHRYGGYGGGYGGYRGGYGGYGGYGGHGYGGYRGGYGYGGHRGGYGGYRRGGYY